MKAALVASGLIFGIALASGAAAKPQESSGDAKKLAVDTSEPEPAEPQAEPTEEPAAERVEAKEPKADRHGAEEAKGGAESSDERFGHALQLGLRAALTGGYRVIFRYDKSPFCRVRDFTKGDKDQQKFCGNGAPLALDLALSFGVLDFIEPYVWARLGFKGEAATNTKGLTAFGAGARIYTMSDSKLKIFVEPAVGMELEGGAGDPSWKFSDGTSAEYKTDFLFHLGVGPQYDFARGFGIYANAGLTTGVLRYIHTELELSGGVQVRVP